MRIDGPNPALASPQAAKPEVKPQPAPQATPVVKDRVDQHQTDFSPTNVVVEMQKGNILVYKFIDEASGKLIEQIPSEGMLKISEAIAAEQDKKDKEK